MINLIKLKIYLQIMVHVPIAPWYWVRVDPQYPFFVVKWCVDLGLRGPLEETPKTEAPCHGKRLKVPAWSKAKGAEHLHKFCSPSLAMVMLPYELYTGAGPKITNTRTVIYIWYYYRMVHLCQPSDQLVYSHFPFDRFSQCLLHVHLYFSASMQSNCILQSVSQQCKCLNHN